MYSEVQTVSPLRTHRPALASALEFIPPGPRFLYGLYRRLLGRPF